MNFAKETKLAAERAAMRVGTNVIQNLTLVTDAVDSGGTPIPPFNRMPTDGEVYEATRAANRVFKSRRAGLAGRKTRRQQRG